MFYSRSTGGFYEKAVHGDKIPADALEISNDLYSSVIGNLDPGKIIAADDEGKPCLIEKPAPIRNIVLQDREWRDNQLVSVTWLRDRHRDQIDLGISTTLSATEYSELLAYIQSLRDWPQSPDFPQIDHRPIAPTWINEQSQ